jgi:beta-glucanase (GH16 family)
MQHRSLLLVAAGLMFLSPTFFALTSAQSWELFWSDEFDCPSLSGPGARFPVNSTHWDFEVGYIRNGEAQWYDKSINNTWVEPATTAAVPTTDCHLVIQALNSQESAVEGHQLTSGSIFTKQSFRYGRIEASLRVPTGHAGTWPAFWLLGSSQSVLGWPYCGEIDVMENVGFTPNINYQTIHDARNNAWRGNDISNHTLVANMSARFVLYAVEWTPWQLQFFTDGQLLMTVPRPRPDSNPPFWALDSCWVGSWPYDQQSGFQIKLNLAIGGSWGGQHGIDQGMFPVRLEADFVRVYHRNVPLDTPACQKTNNTVVVIVDFFAGSSESANTIATSLLQRMTGNGSSLLLTLNLTTQWLIDALQIISGSDTELVAPSNDVVVHGIIPVFTRAQTSSALPETKSFFAARLVLNSTVNVSAELLGSTVYPGLASGLQGSLLMGRLESLVCDQHPDCTANLVGAGATYSEVSQNSSLAGVISLRGGCESTNRCEFPSTPSACLLPSQRGLSTVCAIGAAEFDFGGPEVAYHDSTPWNECQPQNPDQVVFPRSPPDWVDVASSIDGPASVGYTVAGEWVGYSRLLAISNSNTCRQLSAAGVAVTYSNGATTTAVIDVFVTVLNAVGQVGVEAFAGAIQLPPTGSWTTFYQSSAISILSSLPGPRDSTTEISFRFVFPTGGVNYNALTITCTCSNSSGLPLASPVAWDRSKTFYCVGGALGLVALIAAVARIILVRRRRSQGGYNSLIESAGLQ